MVKITKKGKKAWVTFTVPAESAEACYLCGSWNDWKEEPMKVKKSGEHYLTKVLKCDEIYEFGYKSEVGWSEDSSCERVDSPYGSKNSQIKL